MTQYAKRTLPAGKIILLLAAVIALGVVGFAVWRGQSSSETPVADSGLGGDPMSIEALEAKTKTNPNDGAAWGSLGLAYFEDGKFPQAVAAYEKATALIGDKAILWSSLGEARVMASERDPMPAAAVSAFEKAVALDAKDPRGRYFLAVKKDLAGDHKGAIGDWLALLADTPADAPWRSDLVRTIEQVGKINTIDVKAQLAAAGEKSPAAVMPVAARGIPGPSAEDLRNAGSIPPGEQRDMAQGMVSRLEARLQGDPKNVDGWIMLMRSRMTLGEADKASAALKTAIAANPAQADELRRQAGMLGVR